MHIPMNIALVSLLSGISGCFAKGKFRDVHRRRREIINMLVAELDGE
jgi:hypothetical protein